MSRSKIAWFAGSKNDTRTLASRRGCGTSDGMGVVPRGVVLVRERFEEAGETERSPGSEACRDSKGEYAD